MDLSGKGYRELSIWARSVADSTGQFPTEQFKAGGGTDPSKKYQATFEAQTAFVTLTGEWKRYVIPVAGKNLSRVIAALTIMLRAEDNPKGAVFYLDDYVYQQHAVSGRPGRVGRPAHDHVRGPVVGIRPPVGASHGIPRQGHGPLDPLGGGRGEEAAVGLLEELRGRLGPVQ